MNTKQKVTNNEQLSQSPVSRRDTRKLKDKIETFSKIIAGKCSCGTLVHKVLNSNCTMWANGDRYHYPEDNAATCVFRCKDCYKCIHETFQT